MRDFSILAAQQIDQILDTDSDLVVVGKIARSARSQFQAEPVVLVRRQPQGAHGEIVEAPGCGVGRRETLYRARPGPRRARQLGYRKLLLPKSVTHHEAALL